MKETTDSKILVTGMQPGVGPDVVGQSFGGFGAVEEYLSNVTDFFGFNQETFFIYCIHISIHICTHFILRVDLVDGGAIVRFADDKSAKALIERGTYDMNGTVFFLHHITVLYPRIVFEIMVF